MIDDTKTMSGNSNHNDEPLISEAELAWYLSVSTRTVRRWRRHGFLPAVKLPTGRGYRYKRADIDRAVQEWGQG